MVALTFCTNDFITAVRGLSENSGMSLACREEPQFYVVNKRDAANMHDLQPAFVGNRIDIAKADIIRPPPASPCWHLLVCVNVILNALRIRVVYSGNIAVAAILACGAASD